VALSADGIRLPKVVLLIWQCRSCLDIYTLWDNLDSTGSKLVGLGAISASQQGRSWHYQPMAIRLLTVGVADDGNQGAIWMFTRRGLYGPTGQ